MNQTDVTTWATRASREATTVLIQTMGGGSMEKVIDAINKVGDGYERAKAGCGWVFLNLVWIMLLVGAVYYGRNSWELKKQGATVTGTVTSMREIPPTE